MISDKLGDLVYALICGGQHMFGMLKADLLYVCRVSKPCLVLDDPVEIILLKMELTHQLLDGDRGIVPLM